METNNTEVPPSNLCAFTPEDAGPVPSVVALLENILERARRGEIIGIIIGAACNRVCDASVFDLGESNIAVLLLAMERAKMRLLQHDE